MLEKGTLIPKQATPLGKRFTFLPKGVVVIGFVLAALCAPSSFASSLPVGDKAPNFTLKSLSGPNEKLSEQYGKIIVLSFWASWCGSCQPHLQFLNELVKKHANQGMELWVVSLDEKLKKTVKAARKMRLNATILLDQQQDIAERYFIDELPTTVIIDRDGIMRFVHVDFTASDEKRYRKELLHVATE